MAKKNDTLKKIDKELGVPLKGEEFYLLKQHSKLVIAKTSQIHDLLVDMAKSESSNQLEVSKILKWLENFKITIPSEFNIANFPEQKEFPSELKITEPEWLKKIYLPITEAIKAIDIPPPPELIDILDRYTDPKNPLAVRLSDGKKFIEKLTALYQAVQAGTVDQETKDLLAEIVQNTADIEVNVGDVEFNTDDIEAKLDTIISLMGGGSGDTFHVYGEITLSTTTQTTVASFTVPSGKTATLKEISIEGEGNALFFLYVDTAQKWAGRINQTDPSDHASVLVEAVASEVYTLKVVPDASGAATRKFRGSISGSII